MRNRLTSIVLLGAAWGLSSAAQSAEQPASYAANGKCFCNLPIPASLSNEIVSTPIGGQSMAQVCERVGKGPELKKAGDAYNFTVYDDVQCGHGPGLTGFNALMRDAGMNQENLGPKWDIDGAYANEAPLANSSSNTDNVLRLRSRYIEVPPSSKVVSTHSSSDNSAARQSSSTNPMLAAANPQSGSAQSAEELSRMEALPLASVEQTDSALIPEDATTVAQVISQPSATIDAAASKAVRVPGALSLRSRQFEYLSVAPTGYDFGGAGVQFSASSLHNNRYRLLARAGLAEDYQEVLVGATYLLSPGNSDRLTFGLSGGFESGRFNLQAGNVSTNSTSTGVFVQAQSIFSVSRRFEIHGGVGYSGFFEGDPHVFGAALFRMTQKLDFVGEFEAGDNDSAGIGIRYHYR